MGLGRWRTGVRGAPAPRSAGGSTATTARSRRRAPDRPGAPPTSTSRSRRPARAAPARGAARGPRRRAPARRWRRGRRAGRRSPVPRPSVAARPARAPGRGACSRGPARRDAVAEAPARRRTSIGSARLGRACRSTSRGSTVPFQRLASRRTAASTGASGSAGRRLPAPNRTQRDVAPPACSLNATWRPSPSGRGSARWRGRDEQRHRRVALAERREALELLGEPRASSASPGAIASIRTSGTRSSGARRLGGMGGERLAERVDAVALDRQPRGGTVPAVAQQVARRRVQPAEQVEAPGSSGPSRFPRRRRARSAPSGGGGARRSARRRCR